MNTVKNVRQIFSLELPPDSRLKLAVIAADDRRGLGPTILKLIDDEHKRRDYPAVPTVVEVDRRVRVVDAEPVPLVYVQRSE